MTLLKTFWTPTMVYPDVKTGCKFVATYTIAISIFLIALIVYMLNGGESTQMYNPLFELNVDGPNLYAVFGIIFLTYMIISSLLMLKGVNEDSRVFLLPWIFGMEMVILFLLIWSYFLVYGHNTYIYMICSAVFYWIVAYVQFYCLLCVLTQYENILQEQCPQVKIVI